MKHRIVVQNTDVAFDCDEEISVFEAMIRNRKGPFKYGCYGGGCGVCKAQIVSGDFFAYKPMSAAFVSKEDINNGLVLICCVKPKSDLVVAMI